MYLYLIQIFWKLRTKKVETGTKYRPTTSGFICEWKLHVEAATFQGGGRHEGSDRQQANCESPHHVNMPFTVGVTSSLVKRVALKGALAYSAQVVLHVHVKEGGVKTENRYSWISVLKSFNLSIWRFWASHLHVPLLAHGIDHTSLNGSPTGSTDGDAHLVVTGQTVELPLQLSSIRRQLLPEMQTM